MTDGLTSHHHAWRPGLHAWRPGLHHAWRQDFITPGAQDFTPGAQPGLPWPTTGRLAGASALSFTRHTAWHIKLIQHCIAKMTQAQNDTQNEKAGITMQPAAGFGPLAPRNNCAIRVGESSQSKTIRLLLHPMPSPSLPPRLLPWSCRKPHPLKALLIPPGHLAASDWRTQ
jgi:hypothetical protein